jgi:hypothetical protein
MTPTRVLWVSRHDPTPLQYRELNRIFGDYRIVLHKRPVESAKEVVNLMEEHMTTELVVVLPIQLIEDLNSLFKIQPIRAHMHRTTDNEGAVQFEHDYFYRVKKIVFETEIL